MNNFDTLTTETAIEKAVRLAGGQTALARQIGVTQGAVWKWLNKSKKNSS